jgi:pyridoxamine 5'-phosphate oxidase family protein
MFTEAERAFIGTLATPGQVRLARFATSTRHGQPHVVPLRAVLHQTEDKVIVLGREMAHSYKYQQVQKNPKVAIVWDSQEAGPPPTIKGIEVRGTAVIKQDPGDPDPHFEVTPVKVFSWGINESAADSFEKKMGMDVSHLRR